VVPVGTLKPAVTIDRERKMGDLVTIASTLLVNDAEIEDAPGLESRLNNELAFECSPNWTPRS
jgi:hypothetical protein